MFKRYLSKVFEDHWYKKNNLFLGLVLLPFSLIYSLIIFFRLKLYDYRVLKKYKLPVPVVVVGNITVGGTGKTPITKHIAEQLMKSGISVGVVMRGYKSERAKSTIVNNSHTSIDVGDEALIYRNSKIIVAVGKNRYVTAKLLLKEYPDIKLIILDDGLQHYKLIRDYEILILDKYRFLGNNFLIPMGPMRETKNRLKMVDAVVNHRDNLVNSTLYNNKIIYLDQNIYVKKIFSHYLKKEFTIPELSEENINLGALCAIGNPDQFFSFLTNIGIKLKGKYSFLDHYQYKYHDIPTNYDYILVTEKDYVKLVNFDLKNILVVYIDCKFNDNVLIEQVMALLNSDSYRK